jgi:hypothetical protein
MKMRVIRVWGLSAAVLPFLLVQAKAGPVEIIPLENGLSLEGWAQGAGARTLPNTSVSDWWYGCSATSAGMMMGYYDRNGYASGSYPNLVPGGVAEAKALGAWPNGQLLRRSIASTGHQRDFYSAATYGYNTGGGTGYGYLGSGDDQAISHNFDCLADFMGTSQDSVGNVNGSTTFFFYNNGNKTYAESLWGAGYGNRDGMCGVEEYVNWAGYQVAGYGIYSQYTDSLGLTYGFTFGNYKAEIDQNRPVLVHVEGHTMLGIGYDDVGQTVRLYNTWGDGIQTMTWGGSYEGMGMFGVTVMALVPVPEPNSVVLIALGSLALLWRRRG